MNPDVRTLAGASAINNASDGFLSNVLASLFSGNRQYLKAAINILNAFFLNQDTRMNPNMDFGQVIRGPGNDVGTFTGPLDMRGLVKVVNAIMILKRSNGTDWTSELDQQMQTWMSHYLDWLQNSEIGKVWRILFSLYIAINMSYMHDRKLVLDPSAYKLMLYKPMLCLLTALQQPWYLLLYVNLSIIHCSQQASRCCECNGRIFRNYFPKPDCKVRRAAIRECTYAPVSLSLLQSGMMETIDHTLFVELTLHQEGLIVSYQ